MLEKHPSGVAAGQRRLLRRRAGGARPHRRRRVVWETDVLPALAARRPAHRLPARRLLAAHGHGLGARAAGGAVARAAARPGRCGERGGLARPPRARHRAHRLQGRVADALARARGADVARPGARPADRRRACTRSSVRTSGGDDRVDVRDGERVAARVRAVEPEVVFHLAAQSLVRPAFADPVGTYAVNVLGTANVLEARARAARRARGRRRHERQGLRAATRTDGRTPRTSPLGGVDPYSASKAAAELVDGRLPAQLLRPGRRRPWRRRARAT